MLNVVKAWRSRRQWRQVYRNRQWDVRCPHCHQWYRGDRMTAAARVRGEVLTMVCRCHGTATFDVTFPQARLLHTQPLAQGA